MTHILKSDRWLGYGALISIALLFVVPRLSDTSQPALETALMGVAVFGLFAGLRGVFVGGKLSRVCAGLTWPFWAWMIYSLISALTRAKIR